MVQRRLNRPAFKVRNSPIFWLKELKTSKWPCKMCYEEQPPSVCFEVVYRNAKKGEKGNTSDAKKLFLCMKCAEEMLQTSLDKVRIIKEHGVDGLSLFEDV
jgi:hypothetical protein